MKVYLKFFFLLFLCFHYSLSGFSNAAQPGIWDAGGAASFSLLFPEDSVAFKKIQMQSEKVTIALYNGFAVVKGEYWMFNSESDTIELKAGYPVNSTYYNEINSDRADIFFDDLYKLQVKVDNNRIKLTRVQDEEEGSWYVWQTTFLPNSVTKIEVHFLVNTNEADIRRGYDVEHNNVFIYLLESGNTWKQPIEKGKITIALKDGLKLKDINGISPADILSINKEEGLLLYEFQNLSPTSANNIIINYSEKESTFDFSTVLESTDNYFSEIDALAKTNIDQTEFVAHQFDSPFSVSGYGWMVSLIFIAGILAPVIIVILLLALVLLLIRKLLKKRKR